MTGVLSKDDTLQVIELYVQKTITLSICSVSVQTLAGRNDYVFTASSSVERGEFVYVTKNSAAFITYLGSRSNVFEWPAMDMDGAAPVSHSV